MIPHEPPEIDTPARSGTYANWASALIALVALYLAAQTYFRENSKNYVTLSRYEAEQTATVRELTDIKTELRALNEYLREHPHDRTP